MRGLTSLLGLLILLRMLPLPIKLAYSFSPSNINNSSRHQTRVTTKHSTQLFGTIRFIGSAKAQHSTPPINTNGENKSLSTFLTTSASTPSLLGTEISRCTKINNNEEGSSGVEVWECRQAPVGWFGMTIEPVFINQIEKNPDEESVIISIIDARTEVEQGGRLGNTFVSAMKRSKFEGRNIVTWKEADNTTTDQIYALEGSLTLTLTINLPPYLPTPPGFNTIGSTIVERTCKDRLRLSLRTLSEAYMEWTDLESN